MSSHTELGDLTGILLKLGRLVTQQIRDALEALLDGKAALARMVQRREDWVDALELEAHERIVGLLLERQPVGIELRALLSLGNSVRDLERMGNEAERIARAALDTQARTAGVQPPRELLRDVEATAALVIEIVEGGLSVIAQLGLDGIASLVQGTAGLKAEAPAGAGVPAEVQRLPLC
jgi:phosphate transport system protein